jgi:sulfite reductase alpha subunit-like flavoprotein
MTGEKTMAPVLVFFGCRKRAEDFLYADEWEQLKHSGGLAGDQVSGDSAGVSVSGGFVPAFSRDQAAGVKDYVTHRIREEVGTDG